MASAWTVAWIRYFCVKFWRQNETSIATQSYHFEWTGSLSTQQLPSIRTKIVFALPASASSSRCSIFHSAWFTFFANIFDAGCPRWHSSVHPHTHTQAIDHVFFAINSVLWSFKEPQSLIINNDAVVVAIVVVRKVFDAAIKRTHEFFAACVAQLITFKYTLFSNSLQHRRIHVANIPYVH